jgi:hypothetical protein
VAATVAGLLATHAAGVRFRDPDNVAAGYVAMVGAAVVILVGVDVLVRAARSERVFPPSRAALGRVRRGRWTRRRATAVALALGGFYATYLAYRNLKGALPLLRPGVLFDDRLAAVDRGLFAGHDPAVLLHHVFGGEVATQVLSTVYAAFIVFLPLTLALALVFSPRLEHALLYATALSVNWILGIASYYLLPSLGPAYADPGSFATLPHSEVTHMQLMLLQQRTGWLRDPTTGTPQAIAAFASLHVAMSCTALLTAHRLGLGRRVRLALAAWLALTLLATVHFGWHYVVDDLAGLGIGALAFGLAALLTGIRT